MSKERSVVREVSAGKIAELRRRRAKVAPTRPDPNRSMEVPAVPRRPAREKKSAREVQESLLGRRIASMRRLAKMDKAAYLHLVSHLRAKNPNLTDSLTDEEIIKAVFEASNREATESAFKKLGRDKVVINDG